MDDTLITKVLFGSNGNERASLSDTYIYKYSQINIIYYRFLIWKLF